MLLFFGSEVNCVSHVPVSEETLSQGRKYSRAVNGTVVNGECPFPVIAFVLLLRTLWLCP